jgi:DNA-binding NarL/FixJ family response regulator
MMTHTIERKATEEANGLRLVESNYFFPGQEQTLLTDREREVLLHMAEGLGIKAIAHKLHLAESTVITHRKNMMMKTNTKNSVELVAYCIRKQLL